MTRQSEPCAKTRRETRKERRMLRRRPRAPAEGAVGETGDSGIVQSTPQSDGNQNRGDVADAQEIRKARPGTGNREVSTQPMRREIEQPVGEKIQRPEDE